MNALTRKKRRILRDHRGPEWSVAVTIGGHSIKQLDWKDIHTEIWGYWFCAHCKRNPSWMRYTQEDTRERIKHAHRTWAQVKAERAAMRELG